MGYVRADKACEACGSFLRQKSNGRCNACYQRERYDLQKQLAILVGEDAEREQELRPTKEARGMKGVSFEDEDVQVGVQVVMSKWP